jgi:hypothetical protein
MTEDEMKRRTKQGIAPLLTEANELAAIMVASVHTAQTNQPLKLKNQK